MSNIYFPDDWDMPHLLHSKEERDEFLRRCATDLMFFIEYFFPPFTAKFTDYHREFCRLIDEGTEEYRRGGDPQILLSVFRGGAKSTIVQAAVIRALVMKQLPFRFILYISNDPTVVAGKMQFIRRFMTQNPRLVGRTYIDNDQREVEEKGVFFPEDLLGAKDVKKSGTKQTENLLITGTGKVLMAVPLAQEKGISTDKVVGMTYGNRRPDLIIPDDVEHREFCDEANVQKFLSWYYSDLVPALARPAMKIAVGTRHRRSSWITRLSKPEEKGWKKCVVESCFDADGKSVWEELFPTEYLLRLRNEYLQQGKRAEWMAEMENNPIDEEGALFKSSKVRYIDGAICHRDLGKTWLTCNTYNNDKTPRQRDRIEPIDGAVFIDPAGGGSPKDIDFFAIMVPAKDTEDNLFILDMAQQRNADWPKMLKLAIEFCGKWHLDNIVVDESGAGAGLLQWMESEVRKHNLPISIRTYQAHNQSKDKRILGVQPYWEAERVYIPMELNYFYDEIKDKRGIIAEQAREVNLSEVLLNNFTDFKINTKTHTKDLLDCVGMAVEMLTTPFKDKNQNDYIAAHLEGYREQILDFRAAQKVEADDSIFNLPSDNWKWGVA